MFREIGLIQNKIDFRPDLVEPVIGNQKKELAKLSLNEQLLVLFFQNQNTPVGIDTIADNLKIQKDYNLDMSVIQQIALSRKKLSRISPDYRIYNLVSYRSYVFADTNLWQKGLRFDVDPSYREDLDEKMIPLLHFATTAKKKDELSLKLPFAPTGLAMLAIMLKTYPEKMPIKDIGGNLWPQEADDPGLFKTRINHIRNVAKDIRVILKSELNGNFDISQSVKGSGYGVVVRNGENYIEKN